MTESLLSIRCDRASIYSDISCRETGSGVGNVAAHCAFTFCFQQLKQTQTGIKIHTEYTHSYTLLTSRSLTSNPFTSHMASVHCKTAVGVSVWPETYTLGKLWRWRQRRILNGTHINQRQQNT